MSAHIHAFLNFILSLTLHYQLLFKACYPLVFRLLTDYVLLISQLSIITQNMRSTSRRGFKKRLGKKKSASLGICDMDYFCCVVKSMKAIWLYIYWLQFHQKIAGKTNS